MKHNQYTAVLEAVKEFQEAPALIEHIIDGVRRGGMAKFTSATYAPKYLEKYFSDDLDPNVKYVGPWLYEAAIPADVDAMRLYHRLKKRLNKDDAQWTLTDTMAPTDILSVASVSNDVTTLAAVWMPSSEDRIVIAFTMEAPEAVTEAVAPREPEPVTSGTQFHAGLKLIDRKRMKSFLIDSVEQLDEETWLLELIETDESGKPVLSDLLIKDFQLPILKLLIAEAE